MGLVEEESSHREGEGWAERRGNEANRPLFNLTTDHLLCWGPTRGSNTWFGFSRLFLFEDWFVFIFVLAGVEQVAAITRSFTSPPSPFTDDVPSLPAALLQVMRAACSMYRLGIDHALITRDWSGGINVCWVSGRRIQMLPTRFLQPYMETGRASVVRSTTTLRTTVQRTTHHHRQAGRRTLKQCKLFYRILCI